METININTEETKEILHDIKNTAAITLGMLDISEAAIMNKDYDKALSCLERAKKATFRTVDLAKNTFETPKEISLNTVITDIIESKRNKTTLVKFDYQQGNFFIKAKSIEIYRIFNNIITNAFEAMEGLMGFKPEIFAFITTSSKGAKVVVRNSGRTIDSKELPYLFDKGFTTKKEGQGLGLHIVKQLVEQNNGTVEALNVSAPSGVQLNVYFKEFVRK